MRKEWQRGASNIIGVFIILFLLFIMLTSPENMTTSGPDWAEGTSVSSSGSPLGRSPGSSFYYSPAEAAPRSSSGFSPISIGSGNASYAYQSYEEYITLDNQSQKSVDITGWQLRNGKDKRPYYTGSSLQRFSADVALIPKAAAILSPTGNSLFQDVVLAPDERAIVTTGSFGARNPYPIESFKENMCTGYLEELDDYAFNPPLNRDCPRPLDEPGLKNLDVGCRRFVESISYCETPEFGGRDSEGELCPDCVNGELLSPACRTFIEDHYSYQGCLLHHQSDRGFFGKTWRLFLGRGWEMWADEYESIELYDRFGQLINYENY
jgi:hypothetical protein